MESIMACTHVVEGSGRNKKMEKLENPSEIESAGFGGHLAM